MFKRILARAARVCVTVAAFVMCSPLGYGDLCTTPTTYVFCSDCPDGLTLNCYRVTQYSYGVLGEKIETWCNYDRPGWCGYYVCSATVSSLTTSKDCLGGNHATPFLLCCDVMGG